jgi:site-specific DNA-cytosine methylase
VWERFADTTISTAFSGVDTPATAWAHLRHTFGKRLQRTADDCGNLHAIESNAAAQAELLIHPAGPQCIFGNILLFWKPAAQVLLSKLPPNADVMDTMWEVVRTGRAVEQTSMCLRHGRVCTVRSARLHVAGTPCTDWSELGLRQGTGGGSAAAFMCWVGMRRCLQEACIIQENVCSFPTELLERFLGDLYHIDVSTEDGQDYGTPARRERRYSILRHRAKTLGTRVPYNIFASAFHRKLQASLTIFRVASVEELLAELTWMAGRPGSQAAERADLEDPQCFTRALTMVEYAWMNMYLDECGPNAAASLNQDPRVMGMHSSPSGRLHTLIKNQGVLWCGAWNRGFTPSEMAFTQNFPVHAWMTDGVPLCSFAIPRARSRHSA